MTERVSRDTVSKRAVAGESTVGGPVRKTLKSLRKKAVFGRRTARPCHVTAIKRAAHRAVNLGGTAEGMSFRPMGAEGFFFFRRAFGGRAPAIRS